MGVRARPDSMDRGTVGETYAAALRQDVVDVGDATLVGVARRPTRRFSALVDEYYPDLGPPEALLAETESRREDLKARGMCDDGAHNAAWEETRFASRFEDHVDATDGVDDRLSELAARVREGEDVVLVCFAGENKRCHRHLLVERLRERLDD